MSEHHLNVPEEELGALPPDAFGPTPDPQYAMAVVLEQSGFGGANAAPVVARVFDKIVKNQVPAALTIPEYVQCSALIRAQDDAASTSTTSSTTSTTAPRSNGAATTTSTTTAPPPVVDGKPCS